MSCLHYLLGVLCLLAVYVSAQQTHPCLELNNPVDVPTTVRSDLYRGEQAFTVSMLQAIQQATPNENIFFSPYSTYHALLLAYFGASNNTEKELANVLQLKEKKNTYHGYKIEKTRRSLRSKQMPLQFASADRIYFDKNINVMPCMNDIFGDELKSVDFATNAEQCRLDINNWIAETTRNEIPDMLNPGDVSSETQVVLANAAYFKGQWVSQFDPKDTKNEIFYTDTQKHSFVPMMKKRGTYNLAIDETLGAHVLEMPYITSEDDSKPSEISMLILLPPFGQLETMLKNLTPDTLEAALRDGMAREVDVWFPKFEFEQNLELLPILRKMGINSMFDHGANFGDFSATSNIMFGDAKHVAKIKVDEEGSTASAATVLFSFRSARPVEPSTFQCNHPFLFLIYDNTANAVLFTGIYRDPKTQK